MKTNRLLLFLALLSFAFSLMAIFKAPDVPLWFLQIAATEYGPWFAFAPLTIMLFSFFRLPSRLAAFAIGFAFSATILFFIPTIQSSLLAKKIPAQLQHAFGSLPRDFPKNATPFSWSRIWFGGRVPSLTAKQFIYATHEKQPLHLDYYRSNSSRTVSHIAPCVIVIHGGGWDNGTPGEFAKMNEFLAQRGYNVAAVEYRLAPRWQWPAQRQDVLDALHYLKQNAASLGIDPAQFVLLGRSAGGQLSEAVAYSAHDKSIRGCIAFYAPADLELAYRMGNKDSVLDSLELLRDFLGGTPAESPANYRTASPIFFVNAQTPPTLLFHGKNDSVVFSLQSERLAVALKKGARSAFAHRTALRNPRSGLPFQRRRRPAQHLRRGIFSRRHYTKKAENPPNHKNSLMAKPHL